MFKLSNWPYIYEISLTGDLMADTASLLTANGKQKTLLHCENVANTSGQIAVSFGLDAEIAAGAAILHDISAIMKPGDMMNYALMAGWPIFEAERRYLSLLHQRLSAVIAREFFNIGNPLALSAIECHTTLKASPSPYDLVLFIADKLSWDQDGTPSFFSAVSSALETSLARAALAYIDYVLENGMILYPHPWLIQAKDWLEKAR